jgi:hypothetical protein
MATSADYIEVVGLNREGVFRRASVRNIRLMNQIDALDRLRRDMAAWVRPEDAPVVLEAYQAEVAHAAALPARVTEAQP